MHAANPDKSRRLARMLYILKMHRKHGATTRELQAWTDSCAAATDVSELRQSGHIIEKIYQGKSRNGRQVNSYFYRGRRFE